MILNIADGEARVLVAALRNYRHEVQKFRDFARRINPQDIDTDQRLLDEVEAAEGLVGLVLSEMPHPTAGSVAPVPAPMVSEDTARGHAAVATD